jgi:hypothetical protein
MGFGHDNTVSRPNMAIHYNGTDPIVLHDDGLFRYSLRTGLSGGLGGRHADFKEETWFRIDVNTPQPLSEFQQRVRHAEIFYRSRA